MQEFWEIQVNRAGAGKPGDSRPNNIIYGPKIMQVRIKYMGGLGSQAGQILALSLLNYGLRTRDRKLQ